MSSDSTALAEKIDRLDSIDQIRQLASKYALAVDMRDLDAVVGLYVEDVRVTKTAAGRQALKQVMADVLSRFTASVHHVGNHIIEFQDADSAEGVVYCRCEHEVGEQWVPMYLHYMDSYGRVDGRWYFRRRLNCALYGVDMLERPVGAEKMRWPGAAAVAGNWHDAYPSWQAFWSDPAHTGSLPVKPPAAPEKFLETLRSGGPRPTSMLAFMEPKPTP